MSLSFRFVDDVTAVSPLPSGVEFEAGASRVRVEALAGGVFRVRYLPSGAAFADPPFSYAVRPDFLRSVVPKTELREEPDYLRLVSQGTTAVIGRDPLRIHFEDAEGNAFAADDFGLAHFGERVACWKRLEPGEQIYGLGEKACGLNRTERAFTNWNTDYPGYKEGDDPLYKSLPFYMALRPCEDGRYRSYGLFLDNSFRSDFDFGGRSRGRISFGADGGELRYYVFPGPEPKDVLRRYTAVTGRMPLPPRWALGYHQSRWSYASDYEVRLLAEHFRKRDIPLDAIHLDIHYMDGHRVFTWDADRFPEPGRLTEHLTAANVKTVLIIDPGIKADEEYSVQTEGLAAEAFVTYPGGEPYVGPVWPGDCYFPDFTRPAAREWFGAQYRALLDDGVNGIWVDMNEPAVFGGLTMPDIVQFDMEGRGGSHLEAHNVYGLLMARTTYEAMRRHDPDSRPFVLTRACFSGVQRYAAVWTGDNSSTWEDLRLALPMLLSLGLTGVPFAGTDVGGFFGTPTPELFVRWMQVGALSPLFRTHTIMQSPQQEPWSFGPEIEEICRDFIQLRYRLIPLFYTLFFEHNQSGLPIIRPLVLHYPQDPQVHRLDDQLLLGDQLLAAPVVRAGAEARKVYLPEGTWFEFEGSDSYEGGRDILVDAPLDTMPLFVRSGSVLPLGPVRSHLSGPDPDVMELQVYPGVGSSELYEDDGRTRNYRNGDYRLTRFSIDRPVPGTWLLRRSTSGSYESPVRHYDVRVYGVPSPSAVEVDGERVVFEHDEHGGITQAHVPAGFSSLRIIA